MGGNHPCKGVDAPGRLEHNPEAVSNRGRDRRQRARVTGGQLEVRHSGTRFTSPGQTPATASGPSGGERPHQSGLTTTMALIVGSIISVGIFNLPTSLAAYGPITLISMALTTVGALARSAHDAPRPPVDMPCRTNADSACNCLEDGLSSVALRHEPPMCLARSSRLYGHTDSHRSRRWPPRSGRSCAKKAAAGPLRRVPPVVVAAMTNAAARATAFVQPVPSTRQRYRPPGHCCRRTHRGRFGLHDRVVRLLRRRVIRPIMRLRGGGAGCWA